MWVAVVAITKHQQQKRELIRLRAENAELRAWINQHLEGEGRMLNDLVTLKGQMALVKAAIEEDPYADE